VAVSPTPPPPALRRHPRGVPLRDLLADDRDDVAAEVDGVVEQAVAAGGEDVDAQVVVVEEGLGD
jgi:hypothetical protein